jgi:hypothetical protein
MFITKEEKALGIAKRNTVDWRRQNNIPDSDGVQLADNSIQKPPFLLETQGLWVILWKPHEILDFKGGFCWIVPQIPKKKIVIHLKI